MSSTSCSYETAAATARPIIERIIWCSVATVSSTGAPRSRLMHPVWFWNGDAPVALVSARPTPVKLRHLRAHREVACFYWDPAHDTVAIDATARWIGLDDRRDAWQRIAETPAPVGFDPAMIWPDGPENPDCAFLRLDGHRIVATPAGQPGLIWSRPAITTESSSPASTTG